MAKTTAKQLYEKYKTDREPYLRRARKCSELTIPSLITDEGTTASTSFPTPYQSVGARGVNNLAAKLLLTILPPNQPCFRYRIDDMLLEAEESEDWRTETEKALAKCERTVANFIETQPDRVVLFETWKHLIVGGNACLFNDEDGLQLYHLDKFVCKRDGKGNVLAIITRELLAPIALPKKLYEKLKRGDRLQETADKSDFKDVELFTYVKRQNAGWTVHQECCGEVVPGSKGTYPLDDCPWIVLRMNRIDGEDYGRGYIEEYLGDLNSLESLSQSIVEGAAASARLLFLVNPNGTTRAKDIAEKPNGAVVQGNADDVTTLQANKAADLQVAFTQAQKIEDRLAFAFLMHSAIQRNGERVTAEEIRFMAQELENAIGGIYSILSQEFQLPYIKSKIWRLEKAGKLPALPKDIVSPTIVTGIEALGRGQDRAKLVSYLKTSAEVVGPEEIIRRSNVTNILDRLATADGVDTEGMFKTEDQLAQEQQQNQLMALIQKLGPNAVQQFGSIMQQGLQNGNALGQQQPQPPQGEANGPQ